MHVRKFLSIFLIGLVFTIAGCSGSSDSGIEEIVDTDGDGINNNNDPDIDGDGIPNGSDDDIDGDGISNDKDPDDDGDLARDEEDKSPEGPGNDTRAKAECTTEGGTWDDTNNRCALPKGNDAKQICLDLGGTWDDDACTPWDETAGSDDGGIPIEERCAALAVKGPSDEVIAGNTTTVTWQLLPQGCSLLKDQNTKFVVEATDTRNPADDGGQTQGLKSRPGRGIQHITVPCADGAIAGKKVNIVYDFSALAEQVLGQGTNDLAYFPSVEHPVPSKGCNLSIPNPDEGTQAECEAKSGWMWDDASGQCYPPRVACTDISNPQLSPSSNKIPGTFEVSWTPLPEGCGGGPQVDYQMDWITTLSWNKLPDYNEGTGKDSLAYAPVAIDNISSGSAQTTLAKHPDLTNCQDLAWSLKKREAKVTAGFVIYVVAEGTRTSGVVDQEKALNTPPNDLVELRCKQP